MNNEFLTDWGISLMVFLPLAGALLMLVIPSAEETMHKLVALVSSPRSARSSRTTSTTTRAASCSS